MATDPFERLGKGLESPAYEAFEITPKVEEGLSVVTRAVYIGGTGNLYCRPIGTLTDTGAASSNVFFMNVVAGTILPLRLEAVWANNMVDATQTTTAYGIIGLI